MGYPFIVKSRDSREKLGGGEKRKARKRTRETLLIGMVRNAVVKSS